MNARARKTHSLRLFTRGRKKKDAHKGSTAAAKENSFLTFMKIFTEHFSAICLNFAVRSKHFSQPRLYVLGAIPHQGLGVALGSSSQVHTMSPNICAPPSFKAQTDSLPLHSSSLLALPQPK